MTLFILYLIVLVRAIFGLSTLTCARGGLLFPLVLVDLCKLSALS